MTIEPIELYQIYNGIKLHFNQSYDYIKYQGKSLTNHNQFNQRKDKYAYAYNAKYFKDTQHAKLFILAQIVGNGVKIHNNIPYINDLINQQSIKNYNTYNKKIQSMKYNYINDINILHYIMRDNNIKLNIILEGDNQYPIWHNLVIDNKINIESVIILNILLNFFNKILHKDIYFNQFISNATKYQQFIQLDNKYYANLTYNILNGQHNKT